MDFSVYDIPGGPVGQLGMSFSVALMGAFLNYIVDFSLNDQRKDKLQAGLETNDFQFDFIIGN